MGRTVRRARTRYPGTRIRRTKSEETDGMDGRVWDSRLLQCRERLLGLRFFGDAPLGRDGALECLPSHGRVPGLLRRHAQMILHGRVARDLGGALAQGDDRSFIVANLVEYPAERVGDLRVVGVGLLGQESQLE